MTTERFALKGPCSSCPFRGDGQGVGHLRPGRITEIRYASTFSCHGTVDYSGEDGGPDGSPGPMGPGEQVCGGWLAMHWKTERAFSKPVAFAAAVGMFDPHALDTEAVWPSWRAMIAHNTGEPQGTGEPCSVANQGCDAPAGWGGSGGLRHNDEASAEHWCQSCGDPVCESCSGPAPGEADGVRWCAYCLEDDED